MDFHLDLRLSIPLVEHLWLYYIHTLVLLSLYAYWWCTPCTFKQWDSSEQRWVNDFSHKLHLYGRTPVKIEYIKFRLCHVNANEFNKMTIGFITRILTNGLGYTGKSEPYRPCRVIKYVLYLTLKSTNKPYLTGITVNVPI